MEQLGGLDVAGPAAVWATLHPQFLLLTKKVLRAIDGTSIVHVRAVAKPSPACSMQVVKWHMRRHRLKVQPSSAHWSEDEHDLQQMEQGQVHEQEQQPLQQQQLRRNEQDGQSQQQQQQEDQQSQSGQQQQQLQSGHQQQRQQQRQRQQQQQQQQSVSYASSSTRSSSAPPEQLDQRMCTQIILAVEQTLEVLIRRKALCLKVLAC